jgi:hypothetical protein
MSPRGLFTRGKLRAEMRARFVVANQQPCFAQKGDPMAPWHREGTQALGTVEFRSG